MGLYHILTSTSTSVGFFINPQGKYQFERGVVDNLFFSYISIDLSMELYELYVYMCVCTT